MYYNHQTTLRFVTGLDILFVLLVGILFISTISNGGGEAGMKLQQAEGTQSSQNQIVNSTAGAPPIYENVRITMERGLCLGWCPHYYLEVYGDGQVLYEGYRYVNATGERKSHIDPAIVTELVSEFYQKGFFNFLDRYDYDEDFTFLCGVTSQPSVTISIRSTNTYKSVYDYQGCTGVPSQLRYLEDRIDKVTNSSQWIYPRSEESLQEEFLQDR